MWEQTQSNQMVSIWTVCAGEPPQGALSPFAQELHTRWQIDRNAPAQRRAEDIISCARLGAGYHYFSIPDCIYRHHPQTGEFMYASEPALNGPLHPGDVPLVQNLSAELRQSLQHAQVVVCPLGLGTHVDHQLTRQAAEALSRKLWYYADYPYVLACKAQLEQLEREGWKSQLFPVSPGGLLAWQDSVSAYRSQISTFWENELTMRQALADYLKKFDGIRLWRKPGS